MSARARITITDRRDHPKDRKFGRTRREVDVLTLLATGSANRESASQIRGAAGSVVHRLTMEAAPRV